MPFNSGQYGEGMRVFTTADEVIEHLALLGTLRSEDNPAFVELDHGLQCAAILEQSDPDDVELQVAGLIHDLAHPWDGPGQPRHGIMGADAVRPLFGDRMADLVNGHVAAKRYLVATRPEYRAILSADSIMTLEAQGGAMSEAEVREFESHPDWEAMVSLRIADDGAKVAGAVVPDLDHWTDAIRSLAVCGPSAADPGVFAANDPAAIAFYNEHGWVLTDLLNHDDVEALRTWTDEIASWADADGEWLHYREMTDHGPKLCRTENFVPFHEGMRNLLTTGRLVDVASSLLGEPAVLYKEKINYKLSGGAGFAPHQDAPAYPFISTHISCMVAIDDANAANGCLEAVSGMHHDLIETDGVGCIPAEVASTFDWKTIPVRAGHVLWFHSRTPHRSGPNNSSTDRRAIYPTYNASSEGSLREAYYAEKLATMAERTVGNNVQVSLIGDFQGRPVDPQ